MTPARQPGNWRHQLGACLTEPSQLPIPASLRKRIVEVVRAYPMRIPPHLANLIDWSNPRCPIRRQLLPDPRELNQGGVPDPLDEERFSLGPGLVRRFSDRLLALVATTCPALCRHCNRKRTWTSPFQAAGPEDIAAALRKAPAVREVILSGGEPLLLSDRRIDALLEAARSRSKIAVVRIHSRAPVTVPARLTAGLVRTLRRHRPLWFVTHFNHAREVSPAARTGLARLADAGIPVLNQAVLLAGVNDSVRAQADLGRALVENRVKPHYLFQLDRACGTLHFQVPLDRSLAILAGLQRKHSGLLVPHLMVDLPGRGGKVPLGEASVISRTSDGVWLRGGDGQKAFYQVALGKDGGAAGVS